MLYLEIIDVVCRSRCGLKVTLGVVSLEGKISTLVKRHFLHAFLDVFSSPGFVVFRFVLAFVPLAFVCLF